MTLDDISVPFSRHFLVDNLLIYPCKNPAAKRSPAPVRSIIFRFCCAALSIISLPLIATAPFSPLVITSNLLSCFEKFITSSKFFASINELISCSLANVMSNLFLTKFKNEVYVYLHKKGQRVT